MVRGNEKNVAMLVSRIVDGLNRRFINSSITDLEVETSKDSMEMTE